MCLLLATLGALGCVADRPSGAKQAKPGDQSVSTKTNSAPRVVPATTLVGKVMRVNPVGKFLVLSFPLGRLPALDQTYSIYRGGLLVGKVRISGPQLDDAIVADLVFGEAEVGDEAREH